MPGLRSVRILLALTMTAALTVAGSALPATAAGSGSVRTDAVKLTVGNDGVLHAHEKISYDFGGGSSAGIQRTLVTRMDYSDSYDRLFKISGLKASSPDGGPTKLSTQQHDDAMTVTVGKGRQMSGRHTVLLDYTVTGAITPNGDSEQLEWYAAGGWTVPVREAVVTVTGPSALRNASCSVGALNSTVYCTQSSMDHTMSTAKFRQADLRPGQALRVSVGLPAGATDAQPVLSQDWSLTRAFDVNPITITVLLVLLVLLLGGFALVYFVHGRDARSVRTKAAAGDHTPVVGGSGDDGLEFAPPNGVLPGQVGTLIDEQADVVDVTATIVDLAVRGYLLIEELPRGRSSRVDWRLVRKQAPVAELCRYERLLFDAIFDDRDTVKLSELGRGFADQLAAVRDAMYEDVVRQGWFAHRPDAVRTRWTISGLVFVVLGIGATVALAVYTTYALCGLALIIAGAALAVGGQYMPAKTARGSTVLAHTIGFREYLYRADVEEIPEARRVELFSRYLPYAVVFDNIEQWDDTVASVGADGQAGERPDNLPWYHGPAEWNLADFGDSFRTFVLTTSGAISGSRQLRGLN